MNEQQQRAAAKNHVARLRGFYRNLASYIVVNIILIVINLLTEPHKLWFFWVTLFWGIGLVIQAFSVFGPQSRMSKQWEEKKIKEYMDKNK
jgi:Na+/melibiose symporter-like transporter